MRHIVSIAGSDSSAGAGIQADLKTASALGVYAMTVITAVTAQNTQGVFAVADLAPDLVAAQIDAVFTDSRVDGVKIGMVSSAAIIEVIAAKLREYRPPHVVLDPVMVAKSGGHLLAPEATAALRTLLVPLAEIVTPNIPEAEVLAGFPVTTRAAMTQAGEVILRLGAAHVLVKGGHRTATGGAVPGGTVTGGGTSAPDGDALEAVDVLVSAALTSAPPPPETPGDAQGARVRTFTAPRIATPHTHGTGCTLSSAIACRLALGDPVPQAIAAAKAYLTTAIAHAYPLGKGVGPVGHFAKLYAAAGAAWEDGDLPPAGRCPPGLGERENAKAGIVCS